MEAYWNVLDCCVYRCVYYNERDDYRYSNRILAKIPDIEEYYLFTNYN